MFYWFILTAALVCVQAQETTPEKQLSFNQFICYAKKIQPLIKDANQTLFEAIKIGHLANDVVQGCLPCFHETNDFLAAICVGKIVAPELKPFKEIVSEFKPIAEKIEGDISGLKSQLEECNKNEQTFAEGSSGLQCAKDKITNLVSDIKGDLQVIQDIKNDLTRIETDCDKCTTMSEPQKFLCFVNVFEKDHNIPQEIFTNVINSINKVKDAVIKFAKEIRTCL